MFKSKKTRIATILALVLVISCIGGVAAYYNDADNSVNTMTVGGSNVSIVENFDPPKEILPGTVITKEVSVVNMGPSECYVRVKAVFTTSDMEKYCTVDWNLYDAETNPTGWIYDEEDNFWYYPVEMKDNDHTTNLFNTITVATHYDFNGDGVIDEETEAIPESVIESFDVLVYTEAYQSRGYDDYKDAWTDYAVNKPDVEAADGGVAAVSADEEAEANESADAEDTATDEGSEATEESTGATEVSGESTDATTESSEATE